MHDYDANKINGTLFKTSFHPFDIKEIKTNKVTVKFIFNNQRLFERDFETMTRAKPHFHHEIKFSISNFQLLNCQRGKLAGE